MTTAAEGVAIEAGDGVLRITLDRPEHKNALDHAAIRRIVAALESAATDDSLRVACLTGRGSDFCSGADWVATNAAGMRPRTGSLSRRMNLQAHRVIELLREIQLPVVCGVRGWAAGLGFQLALAADFTVTTHDARFWQPFSERGFTPDSGATWLLPRRVGMPRARELLLLGRALDGREAVEWGIAHQSVDDAQLDAAVAELVGRLANGPTVALGLTKWLLHQGEQRDLDAQLADEALALELSSRTADFREGLSAFRDKRPPKFTGR